MSVTIADH